MGDWLATFPPRHMTHLTRSQRDKIEVLVQLKKKQQDIANLIGCSQGTISRELKRNRPPVYNRYTARKAQGAAQQKRQSAYSKRQHWYDNPRVLRYVIEELRERTSPEQITGRMQRRSPWHKQHTVSAKSIYNYIWKVQEEGGCLHLHLRRKGRRPKWFGMNKSTRGEIPNRRDIDERPKTVEKRKQMGHWESDLVVSARDGSGAIATFVERVSKYVQAVLVLDQTAAAFNEAAREVFAELPAPLKRTLTHDNGREISKHEQITKELKIDVYCAHPYSSWERGTNENTNGLLRDFFPKGTDFSQVTPKELAQVITLLNNRPRQSLNFLTPKEVFEMEIKKYAFHGSE